MLLHTAASMLTCMAEETFVDSAAEAGNHAAAYGCS